jgi:hypothetical protein
VSPDLSAHAFEIRLGMQQTGMREGSGLGNARRRRPCVETIRSWRTSGRLAGAVCRCTLTACNRVASVSTASGQKRCAERRHEMASCNIFDVAEWDDFLG